MNRFDTHHLNIMRIFTVFLVVSSFVTVNQAQGSIRDELVATPNSFIWNSDCLSPHIPRKVAVVPQLNKAFIIGMGVNGLPEYYIVDGNTNPPSVSIQPLPDPDPEHSFNRSSWDIAYLGGGSEPDPQVFITQGQPDHGYVTILSNLAGPTPSVRHVELVTSQGGTYRAYGIVRSSGGFFVVGRVPGSTGFDSGQVFQVDLTPGVRPSIIQTFPRDSQNRPVPLSSPTYGAIYQQKLYVATGNVIQVIDLGTGQLMTAPSSKYPIRNATSSPGELLMVPEHQKLYVASLGRFDQNTIGVIDPFNDVVLGQISTGINPEGLAFDSETKKLYVVNRPDSGNGSLTIIPTQPYPNPDGQPVTNPLTAPCISFGTGASGVSVNPLNKYVFIANTTNLSVSIFQDPLPGQSPTISQFYPFSSSPGLTIHVYGSGFTAGTQVLFGGSNLIQSPSVTVVSSTQLDVIVPPSASGTGNINGYLTIRVPNSPDVTTASLSPTKEPNPGNPQTIWPEFVLCGDTTGNGLFGTNDAGLAEAFVNQTVTPTNRQKIAADVYPCNCPPEQLNCSENNCNGADRSRGNGILTLGKYPGSNGDISKMRAVLEGRDSF